MMYRKLAGIILGGALVAVLYQPVVGAVLLGTFLLLVTSAAVWKVYENRTRPIPKIIMKTPEPPQPQQQSAVERELNYIAGRYKERALNNGYQSVEDVPEKLKI